MSVESRRSQDLEAQYVVPKMSIQFSREGLKVSSLRESLAGTLESDSAVSGALADSPSGMCLDVAGGRAGAELRDCVDP